MADILTRPVFRLRELIHKFWIVNFLQYKEPEYRFETSISSSFLNVGIGEAFNDDS